jgi:sodium/pantothenate symporter
VPDEINPWLAMNVLPPALGGIVLAGIVAGIQTTVAAMAIIITSSIARNVLREYKPHISGEAVKMISRWTMGICLIISIALALFQPKLIQWIILFSVGGMEAITFGPILLGLFWQRGNKWGTMAAIVWGMVTYALGNTILPQINMGGMHPAFTPVVTSVLVYIIASLLTAPPSEDVVRIFWGSSKKSA